MGYTIAIMLPALFAECIGTFVFVSVILMTGQALPIGVALAAVIFMIGPISGGHVNPAVSFAMFLKKAIKVETLVAYVIAQAVGAALAWYWYNSVKASLKK